METKASDKGSWMEGKLGGSHPRGGSWGIFRAPLKIDILCGWGGQLYINAFYHPMTLTGRKMVQNYWEKIFHDITEPGMDENGRKEGGTAGGSCSTICYWLIVCTALLIILHLCEQEEWVRPIMLHSLDSSSLTFCTLILLLFFLKWGYLSVKGYNLVCTLSYFINLLKKKSQ